ncbi:MAG TPA: 16S rRNA (cytosine(967)-C(5))-methyltransferase RsmB [Thermodesulfobacteriota bacterium]|nr:16S rRNA (cytosine(967)-C(5))-methyltransferase RsmB [Thermodesulfobacteriota bacterium]
MLNLHVILNNIKMATKDTKNVTAREAALIVLSRVLLQSAYPDLALEGFFAKNTHLSKKEISLVTELVYGVIRWLGKLDYIINLFTTSIKKKEVENLLRLGIYQILFLDSIPDYAAINETVGLAKKLYGDRVGNFVNAVLRRLVRDKDGIVYPRVEDDPVKYISVKHSFPPWLVRRWIGTMGHDQTEKLCHAYNQVPPITVRTNTLKTMRERLIEAFSARDIRSVPTKYSPDGITLFSKIDPASIPEFQLGLFTVQDEASQLISYLLNPQPGDIVLDACSAPGGKSTHIAELMGNEGEVISLDINESRLGLVERQAKRLGIGIIRTVCADLSGEGCVSEFQNRFDKVLVDAPCSGLGTIRRNPDIKWRRGEKDILELSEIQFKILSHAARMVKPNGVLLYSVCTLTGEENEELCERFLKENQGFQIDQEQISALQSISHLFEEKGFFRTSPLIPDMDGFFSARFRKVS